MSKYVYRLNTFDIRFMYHKKHFYAKMTRHLILIIITGCWKMEVTELADSLAKN